MELFVQLLPEQYPEELLDLLEIGGKLVIPVGLEGKQKLYVVTKKSDTENEEIIHEEVAFVPMLARCFQWRGLRDE